MLLIHKLWSWFYNDYYAGLCTNQFDENIKKNQEKLFWAFCRTYGAHVGNHIPDDLKFDVSIWVAARSSQSLIRRVGLVRFDPQWSAHQNAIFQFICIVKAYWPNRWLFEIRHQLNELLRQKSPVLCHRYLEAELHQFRLGSTPESTKIRSGILTSIWRALKFWMPGGSEFWYVKPESDT